MNSLLLRWLQSKRWTMTSTSGGEEITTLSYRWWEYKTVQQLWSRVWQIPHEVKHGVPIQPSNSILGIYPRDLKT